MTKTLILLFHPNLERSQANASLAHAAEGIPGVEIIDMYKRYPTQVIDTDTEVRRLLSAQRIVLQFPVQWYAPPALLQNWKDAVLTRMFYLAYETEGRHLEARPLLVAATAGNTESAYSSSGVNLFPLDELLRPLQATAHRCGLHWSAPFLLFQANKLDADDLADASRRYGERLSQWIKHPVGAPTLTPTAAACG